MFLPLFFLTHRPLHQSPFLVLWSKRSLISSVICFPLNLHVFPRFCKNILLPYLFTASRMHLATALTPHATQLDAVQSASSVLNRHKEPVDRGGAPGTARPGLRSQPLLRPPHQGDTAVGRRQMHGGQVLSSPVPKSGNGGSSQPPTAAARARSPEPRCPLNLRRGPSRQETTQTTGIYY